jgi:hypothetical protein
MQETLMSIQVESPIREKLEILARTERRTLEDETAWLLESGLRVVEGWGKSGESRFVD